MKKRFGKLSILATLSLAAVLIVAGCNGKDNGGAGDNSGESKSIRVFFGDAVGSDNEQVSEAVSKMSEEKIGVKVEMVFFGGGEYFQKMPKMLATNEQMDIGYDSGDEFVSRARDGAYYDISKDLDAYPELKALFGDGEFLGGVTIDGKVYGIPTLKEMAETWAVYIDQETLDRNNINAADIKTIADVEPILAALKNEGRLGFNITTGGEHKAFGVLPYYDTIIGPFVVSNDDSEDLASKKVLNYYETQEFADYVNLLRSWYLKGYIMEDIIENGWYTYASIANEDVEMTGVTYVSYAPLNEVGRTLSRGKQMTPLMLTPTTISNASTRGSIFCIFNKSENKQSSLKFLQLWNTDKETNTLIKFGIEGKHYNFIEEDGVQKVKRADNWERMFLNQNWMTGNVILSQLEVGEPADKYEQYDAYNKSARRSVVLGFTPDLAELEAELSACNAVISTKAATLLTGAVDPADPEYGIEAVKADMKSSGSDKVITELQKQYLDWVKEQ